MRFQNYIKNKHIGLTTKQTRKQEHTEEIGNVLKKLNEYLNVYYKNSKYKFDLINDSVLKSPSDLIHGKKVGELVEKWMNANNFLEKLKKTKKVL